MTKTFVETTNERRDFLSERTCDCLERDLQHKKKFKVMIKKFAMNRGNRRMQQEELVEERRSRER